MAWKYINGTALSDDGVWFGYRFAPTEGDGDVIIRRSKGDKQYKFSIGEIPPPPGPGAAGDNANQPPPAPAITFSSDGRFAAFTVYPSRAEVFQYLEADAETGRFAGISRRES